jgi:hypothetical protein
MYKALEAQSESGQPSKEVIAFAKWSSPHTEPRQEKPVEGPVEGDPALFEEILGVALQKKKQLMGEEEFWCKYFWLLYKACVHGRTEYLL